MRKVFFVAFLGILSAFCYGEEKAHSDVDDFFLRMSREFEMQQKRPIHQLSKHKFNPKSSMRQRIRPAPEVVLQPLRQFDQRPDYKGYKPSEAEIELIMAAFNALPVVTKLRLEQVVCGIYIVNDFRGGGLTDWVEDEATGHLYAFVLINAKTLHSDLETWWTKRLKTVKRQKDGPALEVKVSKKIPAVWHLLFHEMVHALDYTYGLTQYVEWYMPHGRPPSKLDKALIAPVWKHRENPLKKLPWQPNVNFYGFGETRLDSGVLEKVYRDLDQSPFASLYGTRNWNEDLAELFSLVHLQKTHQLSITYRVMNQQKVLFEYKPLDNPKVKARLKGLTWFYEAP